MTSWGKIVLALISIVFCRGGPVCPPTLGDGGQTHRSAPTEEIAYQQIAEPVDQSLKGRDGVVLWIDRNTGEKKIFGNPKLLKEYFLPGSLMKLITAQAAIQQGMDPHYHCTGQDRSSGRVRHCWTRQGHGDLDLPQALGKSCNLFFAQLGQQLGLNAILKALQNYSFQKMAGLSGKNSPDLWNLGLFAIGDDHQFKVTPEEISQFWNQFLNQIEGEKFLAIKQGLIRSVGEGTAHALGEKGLKILAKTGTADSQVESYKTHAWFLGAYPTEAPRYIFVIFLKNAYGFREATELAGKIFTFLTD